MTNRRSVPSSSPSSSDADALPSLTSSPECAASTSIQGFRRAAAAVSRTLIFWRCRCFAGEVGGRRSGGGGGGGDEDSLARRRRRFCESGGRAGDDESAIAKRFFVRPATRMGKEGGGAITGESWEALGHNRGGDEMMGGEVSRGAGLIGELMRMIGDSSSSSESSTMTSESESFDVLARGLEGPLSTSSPSSESSNSQARLSSSLLGSHSSLRCMFRSELPPRCDSGAAAATVASGSGVDLDLAGEGGICWEARTFPDDRGVAGVAYRTS